jgi:hypothetical protein
MRSRFSERMERWSHRTLLLLFGGAWLWVVLRQFPALPALRTAGWPEALLLVTAAMVTVWTLARQVSLQNALAAAVLVGLVGGTAHWASHATSVPFGPLRFHHALGNSPFQEWFFVPTLLWVVLLLNARGVARALLVTQTPHRNHGLHLLGLSTLLVVAMAMALEPFASTVHRHWLWGETRLPVTWHNVPLSGLFAWGAVSIIASFAATPFLINKHPRPGPPAAEPAWIWAMAGGLFAVGTGAHGLWPAATVGALNAALAVAAGRRVRIRCAAGRPCGDNRTP